MHAPEELSLPRPLVIAGDLATPWYRELTRYHWFVLLVAALGWLFDTMDQQLFNLARVPAMRELLAGAGGIAASDALVAEYGGYATSIFLLGWATGGWRSGCWATGLAGRKPCCGQS